MGPSPYRRSLSLDFGERLAVTLNLLPVFRLPVTGPAEQMLSFVASGHGSIPSQNVVLSYFMRDDGQTP